MQNLLLDSVALTAQGYRHLLDRFPGLLFCDEEHFLLAVTKMKVRARKQRACRSGWTQGKSAPGRALTRREPLAARKP